MSTAGAARHADVRPHRRTPLIRVLLVAAVALAVSAVVATSSGTFALWNAQAKASGGGTVKSGTATVAVGILPAMYQTALGPGASTTGAFTVSNTGSVPLSMRVATTTTKVAYAGSTPDATVLGALTMHLAAVSSASACKAGLGGSSGQIDTFDTGAGYYTLPAKTQAIACLEVSVATNAPQSASGAVVDFTITVSGVQVPS